MRYLNALALALLAAVGVLAAGEPISIGETVKIRSKILGEERTILVSTPRNYEQSTERYPVLYLTDGRAHLIHARGTVDFLAADGLIPNLIIVGIDNTDRTRDLSPTHWDFVNRDGSVEKMPTSGGAGKFLDFFAQELFPYVESHYRTMPFRIFAGHSLGGLLSLHIMVARPELFNAFIAASPALNWDDEYPLRSVEAFFNGRQEFRRTLFVAMANEEAGDPKPTRFERLCATLGGVKAEGFAWGSMLMPDENHGSVALRAYYSALRKIFEDWPLPVDSRVDPQTHRFANTLAEIKEHYAKIGKRLGTTIPVPEEVVNQLGYELLRERMFKDAIEAFRYNVELHPDSANVYDSLGEALERDWQVKEALDNYAKATETAKRNGDRGLDNFTRNRDRAAAALKEVPLAQEKLVNVGSYRLNYRVIPGKGYAILLEAGGGDDSTEWTTLAPRLAKETGATVVAYDRAGFGKSDLPDSPYDLREDDAAMWRGLKELGFDRNLVLVGHSYGGFLIRFEASEHPEAVKGLVFIDPWTPEFVDALGVDYVDGRAGFGKPNPPIDTSHPEALTKWQRACVRMTGTPISNMAEKCDLVRKAKEPEGIPIRVITCGDTHWLKPNEGVPWRESIERFTKSMPGAKLIVAEKSDHQIPGREPDLVISVVSEVVRAGK